MPRITLTSFPEEKHRGLWINGPREGTPQGSWRRLTGAHSIRERQLRTRDGTTVDVAISAAHSLARFNDVRFQGATTVLYRNAVSISTGLDGTPLEFSVSEPRTGTEAEYLFVCGGGRVEKVDTSGTVTQWGIDPPSDATWGVSPGGTGEEETATTVVDPQERTLADTTSLTNWTGNPAPFVRTSGVVSASGSAICQTITESFDEPESDSDG